MSYKIIWSKQATKQLLSIPKKQRLMILKWIKENLELSENPKQLHSAKKLQGTKNGWRFRVGSYRLLTSIYDDEVVIEIVRVGHRQGIYENLPSL